MISFVDNMIMGQTTCSTSTTYQDHTQGDQKPYHRVMHVEIRNVSPQKDRL